MIVNDLKIECVVVEPNKTNSPPTVNPNTVLFLTAPFQLFQVVGWRISQIFDVLCCVQNFKPSASGFLQLARQLARKLTIE